MRLIITTSEAAQRMLVGFVAGILLCELYYSYTTGIHAGAVTVSSLAALSVASLLRSCAHSWRKLKKINKKINRGGFIEKLT